jgi:peroxiredoxin
LGRSKIASGLILIAFVIGFGVARYFAHPIDSHPGQVAPQSANPPAAVAPGDAANPSSPANSSDADIVTDSASAPDNSSAPQTDAAHDGGDGAVMLARLVPSGVKNVGDVAQDFSLPDASGNQVKLADYRGKIVFLNFWATWCPTCRGEMASLDSLYREFKDRRDVEFLAVSVDEEGWSKISPFIKTISFEVPVLADTDSHVSSAYQVTAIPTTFIIGRDGRIVWNCAGALDWTDATLKSAIEKLFGAS